MKRPPPPPYTPKATPTPTPLRFLTRRPTSTPTPTMMTPTPTRFQFMTARGREEKGGGEQGWKKRRQGEEIDVLESESESGSVTGMTETPCGGGGMEVWQRTRRRQVEDIEVNVSSSPLSGLGKSGGGGKRERGGDLLLSDEEEEADGKGGMGRGNELAMDGDMDGLECDYREEEEEEVGDCGQEEEGKGDYGENQNEKEVDELPPFKKIKSSLATTTSPTTPCIDRPDGCSDQCEWTRRRRRQATDSARQPTFHPAPRFKATAPNQDNNDDDDAAAHTQNGTSSTPLPFVLGPLSPQTARRPGARFLPGGLASQLQDLLSQVKGAETTTTTAGVGGAVRLVVDEVRSGTRMHLVAGRCLSSLSDMSRPEGECGEHHRYILTGGGGGDGAEDGGVGPGSVLRIMASPAWEVRLGVEWTVACEWSVESSAVKTI